MARRRRSGKRRTEAEWTQIVRRFAGCGEDPRRFCRREGVTLSSFQRWRRRIGPVDGRDFVELVPAAPSTGSLTGADGSWSLEIVLPNGVALRLRG
jgi:hypothetical protein